MTPHFFDTIVSKALEEIPEEFLEKMENVEVLVEDFPDDETLESLGIASRWDLLGLYVGVPIGERSVFDSVSLPERIYLYRRPILRAARGGRSLVELIREVVVHEIGHHFGFDDEELRELEEK